MQSPFLRLYARLPIPISPLAVEILPDSGMIITSSWDTILTAVKIVSHDEVIIIPESGKISTANGEIGIGNLAYSRRKGLCIDHRINHLRYMNGSKGRERNVSLLYAIPAIPSDHV